MKHDKLVEPLLGGYCDKAFIQLLRRIAPTFRPEERTLDPVLKANEPFINARQWGIIELDDSTTVLVASVQVNRALTSRSGKRQQYALCKRILKVHGHNAAIVAFYDAQGCFRLSLVTVVYHGVRRSFSAFRRHTFFVAPDLPNKRVLTKDRYKLTSQSFKPSLLMQITI